MSAEAASAAGAQVLMPRIGQSMEEGTIVQWHRRDGEQVTAGEILVSVETDKATYEIEAPASGPLHIVVPEGEEVPVETLIATIGDVTPPAAAAPRSAPGPSAEVTQNAQPALRSKGQRMLASPRARRLAEEKGIDLSTVTPSSADGMISVEDVERALAAAPGTGAKSERATTATPPSGPRVRPSRERRRLTGLRKSAARRLQESWQTIPHIVQMVEVDATGLLAERKRLTASGRDVTLNDLIVHAAAGAMAAHPDLNGTIDGDELVLYDGVDAGIAVDTPRGLMVPVVRGADQMTVEALAAESRRLIEAAQAGRLPPENVGQASLTVSNLGMFGIQAGTPVINLHEPVLVFVGTIEDRARVIAGRVVARPTLTLSIAYDHRIADGVAAARFTRALKEAIEALPAVAPEEAPEPERPSGEVGRREARSSSPGMGYTVEVNVPGHHLVLDEPVDEGGSGQGPSPVDALLAGLVGCMTISFKFFARRRGITIDRIDGWVAANTKGHLKAISLELEVWSPAPEEDVRPLLEQAERGCFVSAVLNPQIDYSVDLVVHRTAG